VLTEPELSSALMASMSRCMILPCVACN
jgi:hypothetical protein